MQNAKRAFLILLLAVMLTVSGLPAVPSARARQSPNGQPASVQIVSLDSGEIELQLSAPSYQVETETVAGQDFDRVTVPGATLAANGQDRLPVLGALVGVPPEAVVTLEVIGDKSLPIAGKYQIAPTTVREIPGTPALGDDFPASPVTIAPALQMGKPSPTARIADEAWIRDQRVVRVEYRPFEYDPRTGTLVWHPDVRVRLRFAYPSGKMLSSGMPATSKAESPFEPLLAGTLLNYEQAKGWRALPKSAPQVVPPEIGDRYRIAIDQDGIYKLTYAELTAVSPAAAGMDPRKLQMTNQGRAVAIQVVGETDGSFDPGDYILFYGERFRGDYLADLYQNENEFWATLTQQLTDGSYAFWKPEFSAVMLEKYTYGNVYWLYEGASNGLRMSTLDGDPSGNPDAPVPYYRATVHAEQRNNWKTTLFTGEDTWYWQRIQQNDVFFEYTTTLTAPSASGPDAIVRGELVAAVYNSGPADDHHSQIYFNSTTDILDEDYWSGKSRLRFEGTVAPTMTLNGGNTLRVKMVSTMPEIFAPDYYFDWFEVEYNRLFRADGNALIFGHAASGAQKYQVSGFGDTGGLSVLDVSNPLEPVRVLNPSVSSGQVTVSITHSSPVTRTIAMDGNPQSPGSGRITYYQPPDWDAMNDGVDYAFITHHDLMTATQALANYRAAQSGLSTTVIDIQDLYNEFNYGIFHPVAIKNFLAYTFSEWSTPPVYALLVGDGNFNLHNDNTAYYGSGVQYIPPYLAWVDPWQGEVDSANLLANVIGNDPLADVFIARLPVENSHQIDAYRAKLNTYEASDFKPWMNNHLFIADNTDNAGDFSVLADEVARDYVLPDVFASAFQIYQDAYNCSPVTGSGSPECDAVRHAITGTINGTGSLIVNFVGHGSVNRWSHEYIFTPVQFPDLDNAGQLPVIISMDCLDGFWDGPSGYPGTSMIEEIVRMDTNGAVAAFSPTGLGISSGHDVLHKGFYEALLANGTWNLGRAALYAKLQLYTAGVHPDLLHTYTVFGDPAMEIRNPYQGFSASPDESRQTTLTPGGIVTHTITLTNTSPVSDSYRLGIHSNWVTTLPYTTTPLVQPNAVLTIPVEVTVPMQYDVADTAAFTITSRGNNRYAFAAQLHTDIPLVYGLSLTPVTSTISTVPVTTVTHTFTITNRGMYSNTYQVHLTGQTWPAAVSTSTIRIDAGAQAALSVTVDTPDCQGCGDRANLTVLPVNGLPRPQTSTLVTRVPRNYEFSLYPASAAQTAPPGETAIYTLTIQNTGRYDDQYEIQTSGNQWLVQQSITETRQLNPGESGQIIIYVDVPVNGAPSDTVVVTAQSLAVSAETRQAVLITRREQFDIFLPLVVR